MSLISFVINTSHEPDRSETRVRLFNFLGSCSLYVLRKTFGKKFDLRKNDARIAQLLYDAGAFGSESLFRFLHEKDIFRITRARQRTWIQIDVVFALRGAVEARNFDAIQWFVANSDPNYHQKMAQETFYCVSICDDVRFWHVFIDLCPSAPEPYTVFGRLWRTCSLDVLVRLEVSRAQKIGFFQNKMSRPYCYAVYAFNGALAVALWSCLSRVERDRVKTGFSWDTLLPIIQNRDDVFEIASWSNGGASPDLEWTLYRHLLFDYDIVPTQELHIKRIIFRCGRAYLDSGDLLALRDDMRSLKAIFGELPAYCDEGVYDALLDEYESSRCRNFTLLFDAFRETLERKPDFELVFDFYDEPYFSALLKTFAGQADRLRALRERCTRFFASIGDDTPCNFRQFETYLLE